MSGFSRLGYAALSRLGRPLWRAQMLVVTTENVPHYRVTEVKGQCFGVVVRSRGLRGNIMARLHSIVGGEITEYTQLLREARRHAVARLGANATARCPHPLLVIAF